MLIQIDAELDETSVSEKDAKVESCFRTARCFSTSGNSKEKSGMVKLRLRS